jgi:hypothetical protein
MRRLRFGRLVAVLMVGSLGLSAWSACAYAAPLSGPPPAEAAPVETADSECHMTERADCCEPAQANDCCAMDTRLEAALLRAVAPMLEPLTPAAGVITTVKASIVLHAPWAADALDRPGLKLPRAPLYLFVSVFLL